MYTTAVRRDFIAQHFLIGGDWGAENQKHSHHYLVQVELMGETLDSHGYVVDIVEITRALEEQCAYFRDRTLNDLPEFAGLNPSLEHLARIFAEGFLKRLHGAHLTRLRVQIWENADAWVAYETSIS